MGKNNTKKRRGWLHLALILCLMAVFTLIIGAFAYFEDTEAAENYLPPAVLKVDLIDVFENNQLALPGDTLGKDVSMQNNGTVDAVVRIRLSPAWTPAQDAQANPLLASAVEVTFGPTFALDWTLLGGWYYYNKILEPGETTSLLVDALKLQAVSNDPHAADYSGASYNLNILSESLQAFPAAAEDTWGTTYTLNGEALEWVVI